MCVICSSTNLAISFTTTPDVSPCGPIQQLTYVLRLYRRYLWDALSSNRGLWESVVQSWGFQRSVLDWLVCRSSCFITVNVVRFFFQMVWCWIVPDCCLCLICRGVIPKCGSVVVWLHMIVHINTMFSFVSRTEMSQAEYRWISCIWRKAWGFTASGVRLQGEILFIVNKSHEMTTNHLFVGVCVSVHMGLCLWTSSFRCPFQLVLQDPNMSPGHMGRLTPPPSWTCREKPQTAPKHVCASDVVQCNSIPLLRLKNEANTVMPETAVPWIATRVLLPLVSQFP